MADHLCVIKSMVSESSNHAPAAYQMNTGVTISGKPSMGSWITYGLGSENENLPGYVLLYKVAGMGGSANWGNGFLPAAFQGRRSRHEGAPVLDLQPPPELADTQRSTLDLIQSLNRRHRAARPLGPLDLDGRIASYELAYRMQSEALDVGDLGGEKAETLALYGLDSDNKDMAFFGRMCLLSRRLAEKGVRFVQIYNAVDKLGWDGHDDNAGNHRTNASQTDRPIAGLLTDLKRRGLLDETLVVWAGEFGRTPMVQGNRGRNHNPYGFTVWMAGGGVQGRASRSARPTRSAYRAEQSPFAVKDLHATRSSRPWASSPEDLSYEHNGRPERLTGVAGSSRIIPGVLRLRRPTFPLAIPEAPSSSLRSPCGSARRDRQGRRPQGPATRSNPSRPTRSAPPSGGAEGRGQGQRRPRDSCPSPSRSPTRRPGPRLRTARRAPPREAFAVLFDNAANACHEATVSLVDRQIRYVLGACARTSSRR